MRFAIRMQQYIIWRHFSDLNAIELSLNKIVKAKNYSACVYIYLSDPHRLEHYARD